MKSVFIILIVNFNINIKWKENQSKRIEFLFGKLWNMYLIVTVYPGWGQVSNLVVFVIILTEPLFVFSIWVRFNSAIYNSKNRKKTWKWRSNIFSSWAARQVTAVKILDFKIEKLNFKIN